MGVTTVWGDSDQSFMLVTFEKPWTWDDFQAAVDQMRVLLNESSHKLTLLLDIRSAGFPPQGAVRRFKEVGETNHPNIEQIVYIAPRVLAHFIRSINSVLSAAFQGYIPPNFVFVPTLEEAHALMAQKAEKSSTA